MLVDLKNKTALVTGAGRGIGKAIALKLAQCGAKVLCVSKSQTCQEVAEEIQKEGGQSLAYSLDVSDAAAVKSTCEAILKEQRVDILINNAGITKDNLLLRMSEEDWHAVINTNLSSAFYWVKNLIQPMARNRWGRIINVASIVGIMGNAGQANYAAAKAGLIGFTKSLAKEFASRNITANVIAPGWTSTDMTDKLGQSMIDQVTEYIPLKRFGKPEEVADLAAFISSEQSSYMTGKTFSIDGGLIMN